MVDTLIDSYDIANRNGGTVVFTAQWNDASSARGQTFHTGTSGYILKSCKFAIEDFTDDAGDVRVDVYAHTGTYGTNGKPTGAILASSNTVLYTAVPASWDWQEFTFSGANQITLNRNTPYCLILVCETLGLGRLQLGQDNAAPTHAGNIATWAGAWTGAAHTDYCFEVYGASVADSANYYYYGENSQYQKRERETRRKQLEAEKQARPLEELSSEELDQEILRLLKNK